jgi:putative nucleotidyltransferase with HDIG domain
MMAEWTYRGNPTVLGAASGAVAGLVAITPASGFVSPVSALVIGLTAGIVCYFMVSTVKGRLGYDDSLDAFGVHGAGGTIGLANAYTLAAFAFLDANTSSLAADLVGGIVNGLIVAVLATGLLPLLEHPFARTTVFTLLELSNLNAPVLKHLVLAAPGTYHHSIIVGSLVEAGAKSIAANPLLARVSAYYHDIGKLKKPLYFIENAGGDESRHDNITPRMSSLILISHVKDGLELARENRLGQRVAHIIQQHHGTGLITYFYQKAKGIENPEMESLNEEDFRYPGPKPQTKEAGIVMLARTSTITDMSIIQTRFFFSISSLRISMTKPLLEIFRRSPQSCLYRLLEAHNGGTFQLFQCLPGSA